MNDSAQSTRCHVCGWDHGTAPWGPAGKDPSWEICSCCGCEYGYNDATPSAVTEFQEQWIAEGARWFRPKARPSSWDLETHLALAPPLPVGIVPRETIH